LKGVQAAGKSSHWGSQPMTQEPKSYDSSVTEGIRVSPRVFAIPVKVLRRGERFLHNSKKIGWAGGKQEKKNGSERNVWEGRRSIETRLGGEDMSYLN